MFWFPINLLEKALQGLLNSKGIRITAADRPPLKHRKWLQKGFQRNLNWFPNNLLEIALQGPLNSKGIKMNAAGRPPLKITGNDTKKDSKADLETCEFGEGPSDGPGC